MLRIQVWAPPQPTIQPWKTVLIAPDCLMQPWSHYLGFLTAEPANTCNPISCPPPLSSAPPVNVTSSAWAACLVAVIDAVISYADALIRCRGWQPQAEVLCAWIPLRAGSHLVLATRSGLILEPKELEGLCRGPWSLAFLQEGPNMLLGVAMWRWYYLGMVVSWKQVGAGK